MSDPTTPPNLDDAQWFSFAMGEFTAQFPRDRKYAKNHMWALPQANHVYRFGFTAYAVRLLQDVYFLDWSVDCPAFLQPKQEIGSIESKKAESALYAPAPGELLRFNDELMSDPSAINVDKYGNGWLFEMSISMESSESNSSSGNSISSILATGAISLFSKSPAGIVDSVSAPRSMSDSTVKSNSSLSSLTSFEVSSVSPR